MVDDSKRTADSNTFPMEEFEPAPEIYIDGMAQMTVTNGVTKINCFSIYVDTEGKEKRRVVVRLAMPVSLLAGVQVYLAQIIDQLKRAGAMVVIPNVRQ